jgi:hypothetical protein
MGRLGDAEHRLRLAVLAQATLDILHFKLGRQGVDADTALFYASSYPSVFSKIRAAEERPWELRAWARELERAMNDG